MKPVREPNTPVPSRIAEVAEENVLPVSKEIVEHEDKKVSSTVEPDDDLDEFERRLNRLGR